MPIYFTPTNQLFAVPSKSLENEVRKELGKHLFSKFKDAPVNDKTTVEVQKEAIDWYVQKIQKKLEGQKQAAFFQGIFWLHEMAMKQSRENPNHSPISQLSDFDFALYSRVLRLFLEFACDLKLEGKVRLTHEYLKANEGKIELLIVYGNELFRVSNSLSMTKMVPWQVTILREENSISYFQDEYFQRLTHFIEENFADHQSEVALSDPDLSNLQEAILESFKVDLQRFYQTVLEIKQSHSGGNLACYEWRLFPDYYAENNSISQELARNFFSGLILSRVNKLNLADLVYKSSNLNRMIYRPILSWNVDGKDLIFISNEGLLSGFMKLAVDAVGWQKCPDEWDIPLFKNWVMTQSKHNDKVLEDEIQSIFQQNKILFSRKVERLKKWNNHDLNLMTEECGELDFIFFHEGKIFLCEVKHLLGRYDPNGYIEDYQNFVKGKGTKKSFNAILSRKLNFFQNHLPDLEEHFQVENNDKNLKLPSYEFECVFVINTITHAMYSNDFKIYNLNRLIKRIKNNEDWPRLMIPMDEGLVFADYPYFRKPNEIDLDLFDDDGPVDEYGFPSQ